MGRYSDAHIDPQGAGDARPTALQIVQDEHLVGNLVGKVIVVTGVSAGIGVETVRALAATGATLLLTTRSLAKAEAALKGTLEPGRVSLVWMDNTSLASVTKAAATILKESNNRVNILVANAGVMGVQQKTLTDDGHELLFQTNHLSHFLLFQLLKKSLLSSATPDFHSRVVLVASSAHRATVLDTDYSFEKTPYTAELAYANSKLANIYMANEIERQYGSQGLHGLSLHPGAENTELSRHIGQEFVAQLMSNLYIVKILKSHEQGAATTVYAAVSKDWEGKGGKYLEDVDEAKRGEDDNQAFGVGWVHQTYDANAESRLWKDSLAIIEPWVRQ